MNNKCIRAKHCRSYRIDCLKALAIIAVCLYHVGTGIAFSQAYLGVEIFLPISGYLMMKSILRLVDENKYSAVKYTIKQLNRLWPPVLVGAAISLVIGYFVMLPDNYENLAESVVASSVFAENILELITTKNYWDIVNTYKPLMHLWYVGVLMQIQVFLSIFFYVVHKVFKNSVKALKTATVILALISFTLYVIPVGSDASKFYLPWYRLFEVLFGAIAAFLPVMQKQRASSSAAGLKCSGYCAIAILMALLFVPIQGYREVKVILTILTTCYLLKWFETSKEKKDSRWKYVAKIGESSYSIYIVHQIVVAFIYYSITEEFSYKILPCYIIAVILTSLAMFHFVEQPFFKIVKSQRKNKYISVLACGILIAVSLVVFFRAGVVRDVPELDICVDDYHRGMHAEYCDIPYSWNKDFATEDRIKALVLGNSFGRDWANVLAESEMAARLEISYMPLHTLNDLKDNESILRQRADVADIVFYVMGPDFEDIPNEYELIIPEEKLYIVGNKNFGKSNGII